MGGIGMNDRNDQGFALPIAIFVMVIATILVAGGAFISNQELRIGVASRNGAQAFYLAERGISGTMANWSTPAFGSLALWADTTVTDTLDAGVVSTTVTRVGDRLYLLEARSTVVAGGLLLAGATRETGMIVRLFTAELTPRAALTTRGETIIRGTAEVHGEDLVPPGWGADCPGALQDKPGILIDDATEVSTSGQGEITGTPIVEEDTTIADSTFTKFGELDWAALTAMADKTFSGGTINNTFPVVSGGVCNTTVSTNWGDPNDPSAPCGNYFPIIHVAGDASIQSGGVGQGILLVDGSLDLRGNFTFHGIIIVLESFETQGSGNRILGGVMAGNADFDDQALVGGSVVQNSTCAVSRAILNNEALSRPRQLPQRGWMDISALGG
jgi:hypothetical protein